MNKREIPEIRVKYKDVFHLKNLYVMLHEYLYEEGWQGTPTPIKGKDKHAPGSHANIEKLYLEKFCQKGLHSGGKEMWIWWRVQKMPESKMSSYVKYKIDMDFHMVYIQDREVMHQGKKMKIQWGEMEIFIRPYMELDYLDQWENHWLLKHFHETYQKRILSHELEKREKELWREAYRLQGVIKKYLNMRSFIPIPEGFHPAIYGYEAEPNAGGPLPIK
jgi:hypothetical protein